ENVTWEFLLGNELGTLTEDGTLQAAHEGEMVIKASYKVSADYVLEATLIIDAAADDGGNPGDPGEPGEPRDSDDYDDWYDPDAGGPSPFPTETDHQAVVYDPDFWMEEMLRFLIQTE